MIENQAQLNALLNEIISWGAGIVVILICILVGFDLIDDQDSYRACDEEEEDE